LQKLVIGFLFDDTLDNDAGVAQYVKVLGAWLGSRGHEVVYIVGQTKLQSWHGGKVYSLSSNIPVTFNGNRLSIPLPARSNNIKRVIKKHKFNVLHVQVPHSPLMSGRVLHRAAKNTSVVGTFHILPSSKLASLGSHLLRIAYLGGLTKFDKFISVSKPASTFAESAYHIKSSIVPNVVELSKFAKSKPTTAKASPKIVFLGRLVPRKGCQELLEAFRLLIQWLPSVELVIAGDGPERQALEKYVKKNKLSSSVSFLGYISEEDKPGILSDAQIACFPSLSGESFGIVLVEAMATGNAVVLGGNNPGYASVLGAQPELLVNPKDTPAFARRMEHLLNDELLRIKLVDWQREHVKQYDIQLVGPKIEELYVIAISSHKKNAKIG
jgi:phosphatidyl-myo-inositol alpha-mannosyltransferase